MVAPPAGRIGRPLRVLHVVVHMTYGGGIERSVLDTFRTFDRGRFSMDVFETAPEACNMTDLLGSLGIGRYGYSMRRNYLRLMGRLKGLIRERRYDVMHAHLMGFNGAVMRVARACAVPVRVSHYWNTSENHSNDWKRRLYMAPLRYWDRRDSTHIVGCSQAVNETFYPDLAAARHPKLRVCRPGVDMRVFRPHAEKPAIRRSLGIPEDAVVIGHVGRMVHQKNHAFLIEVAARVMPHVPNATLLLVGDGVLRREIEALVASRGLADRVVFAGVREHVAEVYAAMDVFVLCSHHEGFGIVVIEAAATGLPLVCVRIPAVTEAVVPCARPYQFAPGDVVSATTALLRLTTDRALRTALGAEILREIESFSLGATTREMELLYEEAFLAAHPTLDGPRIRRPEQLA